MLNIIDLLKKQIDEQTRQSLNINVHKIKTSVIKGDKEIPSIGKVEPIKPMWTIGSYVLQRGDTGSNIGISVDDFINYSGNILWKTGDAQAIIESSIDKYTNILVGVQVFTTNSTYIEFATSISRGVLRIYRKNLSDSSFSLLSQTNSEGSEITRVHIEANQWVVLAFTFYANDSDALMSFAGDYTGLLSWRSMDITSPSIPVWGDPAVEYQIVHEQTVRGKNVLKWGKNSSIDFAGNGIYRTSKIDTGIDLVRPLPGTLVDTFTGSVAEKNKWITVPINGTLNAGDEISFSSSAGTHTLSRIQTLPKNLVPNPIFNNNLTNWSASNGTVVSNGASKFGEIHYKLEVLATNQNYSISSSLISATIASLYYVGMHSSHNLMSNVLYNIDGYKANPSRWNKTVGVDSLTSILTNNLPILRVVRNSAGKVYTQAESFYVSTVATYYLTCSASSSPYSISIRSLSGATLYSGPTLYGGLGFVSDSLKFTPSMSALAYLQFNIPATTPEYNSATLDFGPVYFTQSYSSSIGLREFLTIEFYNSSKIACGTPLATILMDNNTTYGFNQTILGTQHGHFLTGVGKIGFPSDCDYFKLGYTATINSVSTLAYINRRVFSFIVATVRDGTDYSVYATPYSLIRVNTTVATTDAGSSLYFDHTVHITDRPRQNTDGAIVSWEDFDIEDNTLYKYYLDSYDSSYFKNRSYKSSVATLTTGDTIPPKPPSDYTTTGFQGGIEHRWVNPTATDFQKVECLNANSGLLWEMRGSSSATNSYSEFVSQVGLATRYLKSVDVSGNESGTVMATCKVLPEGVSLPFHVVFRNDSGIIVSPISGNWYNEVITASIYRENNYAIASYLYSVQYEEADRHPYIGVDYSNWQELATGTKYLGGNIRYNLRFKIKDVYGNYSDIKDYKIYIDTIAPTIIDRDMIVSTETTGYPELCLVKWDPSKVNDKYDPFFGYDSYHERSGINQINVYRAEINTSNANPVFNFVGDNLNPEGWTVCLNPSLVFASIYVGESYYNSNSLKISPKGVTFSGTQAGLYGSKPFSVKDGDKIFAYCRVKASLSDTARLVLELSTAYPFSTVYNYTELTTSGIATWHYITASFTASYDTDDCYLGLFVNSETGGGASGYFLVDEAIVTKNISDNQIAAVPSINNIYLDKDVEPWKDYLYSLTFQDLVGNVSKVTPYKYAEPVANYKDKYRNMLDNSSFERVHKTSNGTLQADGWETTTYSGVPLEKTLNYPPYEVIRGSNTYHGQHCVLIQGNDGFIDPTSAIFQNDIHLLPFTGESRKFVISAYTKHRNNTSNDHWKLYVAARNNRTQFVESKNINITVGTTWSRSTGTFTVSVPSISNLIVGVYGWKSSVPIASLFLDAIQFEEKENVPPTDYYDTKSITADYLQGNLIRGHMIETDSLIAKHIRAGEITATQIKSDTITTNELNLANAQIYIKEKYSLPIEFVQTVGTLSIRDLHLALSTLHEPHSGLGYTGIVMYELAGATTVRIINISDTFNRYSYSVSNSPTTGYFANNKYGYPLLAIPFPYTSSSKAGAITYNYSDTSRAYFSCASLSNNRSLLNNAKWNDEGDICLDVVKHNLADLKCYQDKFYYLYVSESNVNNCGIVKFNHLGTVLATTLMCNAIYLQYVSFDISSSGSIFISKILANSATLHTACLSSLLAITTPTVQYATYGGRDSSILSLMSTEHIPNIVWVGVTYLSDDSYCIGYRVNNNNFTYYKIVDGTGSVLAGLNRDLILTNNSIHSDCRGGMYQRLPRLMKSYVGDILYYIPSSGFDIGFDFDNTFLAGKAVCLTKVSATVNLEDLLNRLS
jgi:hypothetical protein